MADIYWVGQTTAVAQVSTFTISTYHNTPTYSLTVGGVSVTTAAGLGSDTAVAASLIALWNASTHPYFTGITASTSGAANFVTLTADTAGVPFTATAGVSTTDGAINGSTASSGIAATATTANASPNSATGARNWYNATTGAFFPPASWGGSDNVYVENSSTSILWNLDLSAYPVASFSFGKTFVTPAVAGLNPMQFQTGAATTAVSTAAHEYRGHKLKIAATTVTIGYYNGNGSPSMSGRINLDLHTTSSSTARVFDTGVNPTDAGQMACRLVYNVGTRTVKIYGGNVGIATDGFDEASSRNLGVIETHPPNGNGRAPSVVIGGGPNNDPTTMNFYAGDVLFQAGSTSSINVYGGTFKMANHASGTGTHDDLTVYGGTADVRGFSGTITDHAVRYNGRLIRDNATTFTNGLTILGNGMEIKAV